MDLPLRRRLCRNLTMGAGEVQIQAKVDPLSTKLSPEKMLEYLLLWLFRSGSWHSDTSNSLEIVYSHWYLISSLQLPPWFSHNTVQCPQSSWYLLGTHSPAFQIPEPILQTVYHLIWPTVCKGAIKIDGLTLMFPRFNSFIKGELAPFHVTSVLFGSTINSQSSLRHLNRLSCTVLRTQPWTRRR